MPENASAAPERVYTVAEASLMLGLSGDEIRRRIRIGAIAAIDVSVPDSDRPSYRIKESEIRRLQGD